MFGSAWVGTAAQTLGESTRRKGRKEDWRRERGGLDPSPKIYDRSPALLVSQSVNCCCCKTDRCTSCGLIAQGPSSAGTSSTLQYVAWLNFAVIAGAGASNYRQWRPPSRSGRLSNYWRMRSHIQQDGIANWLNCPSWLMGPLRLRSTRNRIRYLTRGSERQATPHR